MLTRRTNKKSFKDIIVECMIYNSKEAARIAAITGKTATRFADQLNRDLDRAEALRLQILNAYSERRDLRESR